jgi:NRPS condensation-like uncharacterized protein
MARMGRPPSDNSKKRIFTIRVQESFYQRICEYAKQHNLTVTDVVMRGLEMLLSKPE